MKSLLLVSLFLVLAGCATPYKEKSTSVFSGRGYSSSQLSPDTFDVYFEGGSQEEERARDFVLLRAAELCLNNQFRYFTMTEESASVPNGNSTGSFVSVVGTTHNVFPVIGTSSNSNGRTTVRNRVKCLAGSQSTQPAYEASFVQESIRRKYQLNS